MSVKRGRGLHRMSKRERSIIKFADKMRIERKTRWGITTAMSVTPGSNYRDIIDDEYELLITDATRKQVKAIRKIMKED